MNSNISEPSAVAVSPSQQYLSFFVAGEEYAVNILEVKELVEYSPVTRVPSMPPFVKGVVNMRGSVVQVIDLALRFGFPETVITKWTCLVMLELVLDGVPTVVGVLADSVSQVVEFKATDISAPPAFGTRAPSVFLKGLGSAGQRFVLILAVDALVSLVDLAPAPAPAPAELTAPEAEPPPHADATPTEPEA